jgi:predicted alpha/beta-fold hydrolase
MSQAKFKPAWWLPNAHYQTLWQVFFRRSIKHLSLRRERIELADGDFVDLDWVGNNNAPIVLILHGLEGSAKSFYVRGMLQAVLKQGWRGVCMNFRSCSGERNRLARAYHSGETADIAEVAHVLRQREPQTLLAAIGFSLGGNVLLKWLGETGRQNPLTAAVAISVPFELEKAAERMTRGFSQVYQWRLLRSVYKKIQWKFQAQAAPMVIPSLHKIRTFRDFDNQVTAPLHGFVDAKDYYTQASSRQFLPAICVPTLLLQAEDDPFVGNDSLPQQYELSKQVMLEITKKGGHVGFVAGQFPWCAQYWLEQRAPDFLGKYLS